MVTIWLSFPSMVEAMSKSMGEPTTPSELVVAAVATSDFGEASAASDGTVVEKLRWKGDETTGMEIPVDWCCVTSGNDGCVVRSKVETDRVRSLLLEKRKDLVQRREDRE